MNSFIDNIYNLTQNMDEDYRLRMAVVAILVITCLIIILLIWLLLRGVKLWYWKIDTRIEILQDIDRDVQEIRKTLNERPIIIQRDEQQRPPIKKIQNSNCGISKSGRIYTQDELELQIKD